MHAIRILSAAVGLSLSLAAIPAGAQLAGPDTPGLTRLLGAHEGTALTRGIATFDAVPTAAQAEALRNLGLITQPLERLPLALVYGNVASMQLAVSAGAARDVYPDERLDYFDTASSGAIGATMLHAAGLTGQGVTVGVVDSGCDATHPDLADHVVHNVKLVSGEYVNLTPDSSNRIVIPVDVGPYNNSDLGSGHGTHVAGIIAADSSSDPLGGRFGVAPDASLVCMAVGEVLFTTAVVTAYDYLLDQPDLLGVDVINNSWGNSFRQFDPRDPVAIATRAVADLGAVVVFAAGNSGYENAEMSLNPFSQSPWVYSVAAGDLQYRRGDFSSNGLIFDNSQAVQVGAGGHTVFTGDRVGIYHPDFTAPGVSISSSCTPVGAAIPGCQPNGNLRASGTSMAAPHIAGAVALLLQANPALKADQIRSALQASATPVYGADGNPLPFWQVGYGYVDLEAAVALVTGPNWSKRLAKAQSQADARVKQADGFSVTRSDFWTWDAPRAALAGSDARSFATAVPSTVSHLKITLSHPSGAVLGENLMEYTVTVRDAAGQLLGVTTEAATGAGTASLFLDLRSFTVPPVVYGAFTFEVSGEFAVSDPDTFDSESLLGRMVTLQVAQLKTR
ncbi:MAG TPA: S8 family serine peptidase [Steroidobacteraceae bacterium]|jgi:serine protease AprX